MFGNVGLKDRLTFSAFGSAVNEVQRLQELTKKYPHNIIASEAFAGYSGGSWTTLGQEKLRGVAGSHHGAMRRTCRSSRRGDGGERLRAVL